MAGGSSRFATWSTYQPINSTLNTPASTFYTWAVQPQLMQTTFLSYENSSWNVCAAESLAGQRQSQDQRQRLLNGPSGNQNYVDPSLDAYDVVDITVSKEFEISDGKLEAFLTVNNLLDERAPLFAVEFGTSGPVLSHAGLLRRHGPLLHAGRQGQVLIAEQHGGYGHEDTRTHSRGGAGLVWPAPFTRTLQLRPIRTSTVLPAKSFRAISTIHSAWYPSRHGQLVSLAEGFSFTEGPAADRHGNVFFTDQPNDRIYRWDAGTGKVTLFLEGTGRANGMIFDREGNLIAASDMHGELWKIRPDGSHKVLVDNYQGKLLNGPNDVWINPANGGIYITDPIFPRGYWDAGDPRQQAWEPTHSEQSPQGKGGHVYYLPAGGAQARESDVRCVGLGVRFMAERSRRHS